MPDLEKIRQLDELLNFNDGVGTVFSVTNLLGAPKLFLSYCFDIKDPDDETAYIELMFKKSPKYDSRVENPFDNTLQGEKELHDFCQKYIDYIDLDRLGLFLYYRLNNANISKKFNREYRSKQNEQLDSLKKVLRKYYKPDATIYFYNRSTNTKKLPSIEELTLDSVLGYNRSNKKNNLDFLTEEQYQRFIKYFNFDSARELFGDHRLYSVLRMYQLDLMDNKELSDKEKTKILMNNKYFKNTIDVGKYILTLNYGIVDFLKNSPEGITLDDFIDSIKDFADINYFVDQPEYSDPNFKDKFANRNFLAEFDDIALKLTKQFLEMDGSNIDKFLSLGLLNKELFVKYLPQSQDKESSLAFAKLFGTITDEELDGYCKEYNLERKSVQLNAFYRYLNENGIKKNNFINYPIEDEAFRKLIPKEELSILVAELIKNNTKYPDSTNASSKLYMLIQDGIIDESFIKRLYINNELSYEDIKTVKNLYDDYNISSLYGFDQSTKQLVTFYKYLYADIISNAIEQEGDKYDEKTIFVDPDEYLIKENYDFQRKIFRECPKNRYTRNRELEDELDYLILYTGVAKHLYHQGLIDIFMLKDKIDDAGIAPEKRQTAMMILNGEVRQEDLPFLVKDTILVDNPLVLTQLYESGNITYREIIEKYLAENISYESLISFGDGRDLSSAFNENRYLALFANAIKTSNSQKLKIFAKYKKAYQSFVHNMDNKRIYSRQKAELSRCNNDDKFAKYYRENVIDGQNLLDLIDDNNVKSNKYIYIALADLINTQDLKVEDCALLFKDEGKSHAKRDRLEYIFNNYNIPDDIKIKTLLDTYIENSETDIANYEYLLNNCFSKAQKDTSHGTVVDGKNGKSDNTTSEKKEQEVMPYPMRYKDIISLDPSMTSKILGSKILFHSEKYNKYIFEQMYTTQNNINVQLTTHATYSLSDELVNQIADQLFKRDKDGNIIDFDYGVLIDTYRYGDREQVGKTLHKSKSWISQLKKKIIRGHKLTQTILEQDNDIEKG